MRDHIDDECVVGGLTPVEPETLIDHCDVCGFDARALTVAEVTAQIDHWATRVVDVYRTCPEPLRRVRPDANRWSMGEYVLHLVHALSTSRWFVEQGLAADRPSITPPDPDETITDEVLGADEELLARLGRRVDRLTSVLRSIRPGDEERTIVLGWSRIRGTIGEVSLAHVARNALHELVHHHDDLVDICMAVQAEAASADR